MHHQTWAATHLSGDLIKTWTETSIIAIFAVTLRETKQKNKVSLLQQPRQMGCSVHKFGNSKS